MSQQASKKVLAFSAKMPRLNSKPLQPPSFHSVQWTEGQVFSAGDDPDRINQPFAPPDFVNKVNPKIRSKEVSYTQLDIGTTCTPSTARSRSTNTSKKPRMPSFASIVANVLTQEECSDLLNRINVKGFTPALVNIGRGNQILKTDTRDGWRVIIDAPDITQWLMEVLRPYLPTNLANGSTVSEINERCRFLCYTPGQKFEPHFDGRYRRPVGHPKWGDHSRITLQMYLNDVPETFGGATSFIQENGGEKIPYQPKAGSVLMFTQDLLHEGSSLVDGIKYTMRSEIMYTPKAKHTADDVKTKTKE